MILLVLLYETIHNFLLYFFCWCNISLLQLSEYNAASRYALLAISYKLLSHQCVMQIRRKTSTCSFSTLITN